MAGKIPCWLKAEHFTRVVESSLASSAAVLRVMWMLLDDLDRDGRGRCFPSLDRLIARTGLSRRAVINAIDQLERAGYLTRETGRGRGNTTHYRFPQIEQRLAERAGETVHDTAPFPAGGPAPSTEKGHADAPFPAEKGARPCPEKVHARAPETPESSPGDSSPSPPAARQKRQQGEMLMPIEGEKAKLLKTVSQGFRISRDRAEPLVDAWLEVTDTATLKHMLARAQRDGVTRDDLPGHIRGQLPDAASQSAEPAATSSEPAPVTMDPTLQRVITAIAKEDGTTQVHAWFREIAVTAIDGDTVHLQAPSRFHADWLAANYADRIRAHWREHHPITRIEIHARKRHATG